MVHMKLVEKIGDSFRVVGSREESSDDKEAEDAGDTNMEEEKSKIKQNTQVLARPSRAHQHARAGIKEKQVEGQTLACPSRAKQHARATKGTSTQGKHACAAFILDFQNLAHPCNKTLFKRASEHGPY
ncbi:hypothetical protein JCGZ_08929 [Jatropha curcas]|uniref:Uncharacterized protein n=1 Tax=Jatropha curcas TaxID=180498 RepID=A0A067LEP0_JATCU|nr:hypothetical protein JCGZ_08929 [Jatropha curcas]